jgi:aryl-alcohol dehydrogenase-like predicted oxidoreductase
MLAYSPLANGLLTGKIGLERQFPPDDLRYNNPRFSVESRREVQAFLDQIRPIATDYQVTLAQIVIAWTLAQPGVTHALVGARDGEQALENARVGRITLLVQDLNKIEKAWRETFQAGNDVREEAAVRL